MADSSSSSLPPRRRLPDDDHHLEEGQFVPTGAACQQSSHTDHHDDAHPPHSHYRRLSLDELLSLGRGDALPSCDSDGTISDDRGNPSPVSVFRAQPNRQPTGGKLFSAASGPLMAAQSSHSNVSVSGDSTSSAHAAAAVHRLPPPAAQPRSRHVVVPRRAAHRPQREYTCKFCGKSYTSHQALGGHVAKHKSMQREAEAAAVAGMAMPIQDGAALRRARRAAEAAPHHQCRKCHKVFATGVALGGHMRVHYTGPPIVPARNKNNSKKQGLAPLLAVQDVAVAALPPPTGLSLALSIKAEEAPSAAPAGAGRVVVRLFGIDISPKAQAAPLLEQQCSGTIEDFSVAGAHQQ
ncbi:hypothetical protein PVAP13_3KG008800 [Panicum virgatum]|uniref:C2H2-type domain-containing protein n=1 Tax=Panicum virgatum TaxID=38727 RepID=A0A8T0UL53_PANVG|nr:hypothetical protein PVAP13_3KG008800 [Panicum virgatum]